MFCPLFLSPVEDKIRSFHPYLVKTAKGDEDLVQEGAIGIWEAMRQEPEASDGYFRNRAKWNIQTVARGVGKSLDIPKWYRRKTVITLIPLDAIPSEESQLTEAALPDRKRVPLDELVMDKVDFERFLATLTIREAGYLLMKLVWGIADNEVAERMDISITWLRQMKTGIRNKIEAFYTV